MSTYEISEVYDVNPSTIQRIVKGKTYSEIPLPTPSLNFLKQNHIYTKEQLDKLINDFIDSHLNLKEFYNLINSDSENLFNSYKSYEGFKSFIYKELKNRGLKYKSNNKWEFEIISIN